MDNKKNNKYFLLLGKSLLLSFIVSLVFFIIFTLIFTYTSLGEKWIPLVNTIILILSISLGAIKMSINSSEKGFINGGIVGLSYMLVLILFSIIAFKSSAFSIFTFTKLLVGLFTGMIAGMIGVNLK
ncbi:MAG: TIGR04086 family membrane protein [Senegalia sp. (in: firmicutes)]|uniref:TIGR04086 family membrane protein n=1 Tax=Senegalia sp. (in: firmicutes) TaxID=1924098 RepID=UPI003F98487E